MLLDYHRNLLLLGFKSLVLCEVLHVLGIIALKNFLFADCALIDLHELLDCIELIMHGHTIVHDLLLALADRFQLVKLLFDLQHSWVIFERPWLDRLRDHLGKFLACFAEQHEALLVGIEFSLDLGVSGHSHIHLAAVFDQALLVLLVDGRGWWPVELVSMLRAQVRIFFFFLFYGRLAGSDYIQVDLAQRFGTLDRLREVL